MRENICSEIFVLFLDKFFIDLETFDSGYMVLFLSDEWPMLETLEYTIRIGSTPTFLYFDFYLYSAYAAHYVYLYIAIYSNCIEKR